MTILSETRLALNKAGIKRPYVLCPYSMSRDPSEFAYMSL